MKSKKSDLFCDCIKNRLFGDLQVEVAKNLQLTQLRSLYLVITTIDSMVYYFLSFGFLLEMHIVLIFVELCHCYYYRILGSSCNSKDYILRVIALDKGNCVHTDFYSMSHEFRTEYTAHKQLRKIGFKIFQ